MRSFFQIPARNLVMSLAMGVVLLFCMPAASASPDLGTYLDIDDVRVYRDHKKTDVFYPAPGKPAIVRRDGTLPDVSLEVYRYVGRKGTGDSGAFRVNGILGIGIARDRNRQANKKIKAQLSRHYKVKRPKLRTPPVTEALGRLIFADKDIRWSQGSRWSGKKITVPLDPEMSQILWAAVEAGQTQVSIEVIETVSGVRENKDGKWDEATVEHAFTLPVELDMAAYPSLFNRTDLGGRMVRGYTGIDLFCFDFIENLDPDLYSKMVEIAIPTPGKPQVETHIFRQDSSPRERIAFTLAKDLDTAYKVRITRVLKDGTTHPGPWVYRAGEAMLDITDYREPEEEDETDPDEPADDNH